MKIGEAFYQRIAKPIGMQDFQPSDVFYFGGPLSIHPAYHFEITARDLARFGLLYLRHGRWNGKQIVPEAWVEKSSHASEMVKANGVDRGRLRVSLVGGLRWCALSGSLAPWNIFRAGQRERTIIFIIPTLDLVVVHRTDNDPPVRDAKTIDGNGEPWISQPRQKRNLAIF